MPTTLLSPPATLGAWQQQTGGAVVVTTRPKNTSHTNARASVNNMLATAWTISAPTHAPGKPHALFFWHFVQQHMQTFAGTRHTTQTQDPRVSRPILSQQHAK